MILRVFAAGFVAAMEIVALAAAPAMTAGKTVRVTSDQAVVLTRANRKAERIATVPAGTVLETLDKQDDWYWVLLDRDEHGTRRVGWIHADALETGSGVPATAASKERPKRKGETPKTQKDDDRSLKKAERALEKARRKYEKASQPRTDSPG